MHFAPLSSLAAVTAFLCVSDNITPTLRLRKILMWPQHAMKMLFAWEVGGKANVVRLHYCTVCKDVSESRGASRFLSVSLVPNERSVSSCSDVWFHTRIVSSMICAKIYKMHMWIDNTLWEDKWIEVEAWISLQVIAKSNLLKKHFYSFQWKSCPLKALCALSSLFPCSLPVSPTEEVTCCSSTKDRHLIKLGENR